MLEPNALLAMENAPMFSDWFDLGLESAVPSPAEKPKESEPRQQFTQHQSRMLSEIQIPLTVNLGTVTLSAASVIDLLPGQIVSYPLNVSQEVTLAVGHDPIATARLVLVEGALALEIVRVTFSTPAGSEKAPANER